MAKLTLRIQLISYVLAAGAFVVACGDGATNDDSANGTGGTPPIGVGGTPPIGAGGTPATGGGTNTGGTTGGSFETACTSVACGSNALIDDFADGDTVIADANGTVGYWSSWVDPAAAGATISTPETAIAAGKLTIEATGLLGSDGANFGAGLNNLSAVNCGLNASSFDGIEIVGKTLAVADQTVRLRVVMPEVVPIAEGGLCGATDSCWGTHYVDVVFGTEAGIVTKLGGGPVVWADFTQPEWATPVAFDPARITTVELANVPLSAGFHIEVTSLGFSGGSGGGAGGAGNCE